MIGEDDGTLVGLRLGEFVVGADDGETVGSDVGVVDGLFVTQTSMNSHVPASNSDSQQA